jgi:bifunctional DNase/RNase
MSVLMELQKIIIRDTEVQQFIWLKEVEGERNFPIVIGIKEAEAINRRLKGEIPERPMTHDLLASVIEKLGGKLEQIEITNLTGGTYFAELTIRRGMDLIEFDSRPSDAIALGIATSVPIFVAEHVLEEACG